MRYALVPLIFALSATTTFADPPGDAVPIDAGAALACVADRYRGEALRIEDEEEGLV